MVKLQIETYTDEQRSPVTGGKFKPLSKDYAKFKQKKVGNKKADLHLTNKMINSIRADFLSEKIRFKIEAKKQIPKAYNHNTGDTLEQRQFMPDEEARGTRATFHKGIREAIQEMINDASES